MLVRTSWVAYLEGVELKATGITCLSRSSHGVYYWKAKINGSVRQGTLGTKSMSTAKSRLYRRLQAGKRQYQGKHLGKIVTLGEWAREWLRRGHKLLNSALLQLLKFTHRASGFYY